VQHTQQRTQALQTTAKAEQYQKGFFVS